MKTLYSIVATLVLSSIAYSQSGVKIVSKDDNIDYTSQTVTFSGDGITVGGEFYIINTTTTTNDYRYGVFQESVSDPDFKFQFCEIKGGSNPGLCYNSTEPIGSFWLTPAFMQNIAPGDTMIVDIKMNTALHGGTGKAVYYVLNGQKSVLDSITTIFTSTAALDKQELPTFKIYPNPAKEGVTIQGEALKNGGVVIFRNALGQEVKRVNLSEMHTMINVSTLNKGVYFVSVLDKSGVTSKVQRLIIQ